VSIRRWGFRFREFECFQAAVFGVDSWKLEDGRRLAGERGRERGEDRGLIGTRDLHCRSEGVSAGEGGNLQRSGFLGGRGTTIQGGTAGVVAHLELLERKLRTFQRKGSFL
jgi:hypothetical protein